MIYVKSALAGFVATILSFALVASLTIAYVRSQGLVAVAGGFGISAVIFGIVMFVVGFVWEFRRIR